MRKTICLNMIVKDESRVIRRCLDSVKEIIDTWVIVDTGSTDQTQAIIREALANIPGALYERPWVNFGHNRNEALALAKGKADYILFIDADDRLVFSRGFAMPPLKKDVYRIVQRVKYVNNVQAAHHEKILMIKDVPDFAWTGVLHETLIWKDPKTCALLDGVIEEYLHDGSRSRDPASARKDAEMLEKADLSDPRNVFYLGQTYRACGERARALATYEKRASMNGSKNEIFHSLYFIGLLQKELQFPSQTFLKSYCRAYLFMPSRAEPLYQVLLHFIETKQFFLGFLLAQFALSLPLPTSSELVVEPWLYDWGFRTLFVACALEIGDRKSALSAFKKLPPDQRRPFEQQLRCG